MLSIAVVTLLGLLLVATSASAKTLGEFDYYNYPVGPSSTNYPSSFVAAPDGDLWITNKLVQRIGSLSTTAGTINNHTLITSLGAVADDIVYGPDGAI